jgi:hypothetical protein
MNIRYQTKHGINRSGLLMRTGVIATLFTTLLLTACQTERPVAEAPGGVQPNVQPEEVVNQTEQLIGKTVTVRSEPVAKVDNSSFTINDEQFFGATPILVVNTSGKPFVLPTDSGVEVQVTGPVQRLVVADVEREYGLDLDPNLYAEYESRPVIYAQSIALAPEPGEITQNPAQYYNQQLAVTGEVENVQSATVFTLDEDKLFGAQDLLVINRTTGQPVPEGETVAVTGTLRQFVVADLERDYDLNWDLNVTRQLEAEYSNRPVLVADQIFPSAIPE